MSNSLTQVLLSHSFFSCISARSDCKISWNGKDTWGSICCFYCLCHGLHGKCHLVQPPNLKFQQSQVTYMPWCVGIMLKIVQQPLYGHVRINNRPGCKGRRCGDSKQHENERDPTMHIKDSPLTTSHIIVAATIFVNPFLCLVFCHNSRRHYFHLCSMKTPEGRAHISPAYNRSVKHHPIKRCSRLGFVGVSNLNGLRHGLQIVPDT